LAYRLTLAEARISTLERANEALSKCRRAKRTQIHQGGALSIGEAKDLLAQREVDVQVAADQKASSSTTYRCSKCGRAGHNMRTCRIDAEMVDVSSNN
jgi:formylmethanofuran dehydrogenase subunit E